MKYSQFVLIAFIGSAVLGSALPIRPVPRSLHSYQERDAIASSHLETRNVPPHGPPSGDTTQQPSLAAATTAQHSAPGKCKSYEAHPLTQMD